MAINLSQPMRPAEIDIAKQLDTTASQANNTETALNNEITNRTNADNALQNSINTVNNRVTTVDNRVSTEATARSDADSTLQNNINTVNAKFPVQAANIGDLQVTNAKLADSAVNASKIEDGAVTSNKIGVGQVDNDKITDKAVTTNKLSDDLQEQITFLKTVPQLSYGESEATTVPANSNVLVDVTFPNPLTEEPNVYCMARSTVCIECNVEQVTNSQVSIRLYNNTATDAEQVSIDWLAISGR